jgi:hypothetical protein
VSQPFDVHGEDTFTPDDLKTLVLHLLAEDHGRAHERKNESSSQMVRDSLSARMRLIESAQTWVKEL